MVFAGLCEYWKAPDEDQWLQSAAIITTSDNPEMHEIHNRMPVILEKSTDEDHECRPATTRVMSTL